MVTRASAQRSDFCFVLCCSVTLLYAGVGRNNELYRTQNGTVCYRFASQEEGRQLKMASAALHVKGIIDYMTSK